MSFFNQQDKDYFNKLSPSIKVDMSGTLILRLNSGEFVALSAFSVAELLELNLSETKNILKEAMRIAVTSNISNASEMSNILVNIADMVVGDLSNPNSYPVREMQDYEKNSLLSLKDIAYSLKITFEFAHKLFHNYKKPISNEHDLEDFMLFVDKYLQTHHDGNIPQNEREIHVKNKRVTQTEFTKEHIDDILAGTAPEELRPQADLIKEGYLHEARNILCKLLEINYSDASLILNSAYNLQEFMYMASLQEAEYILDKIYIGDYSVLIDTINQRVDAFIQNDQDNTDNANISQSAHDVLGNEISFSDTVIDDNIDAIKNGNITSEINIETDNTPVIPENIEDILQLCFDLKGRITSKSLVEIFAKKDIEISQSLAKFIIEDGGYGGDDGDDKKRIITQEKLDELKSEISSHNNIKDFIKIYLKRVNDQVQNMFYGKR